MPCAEASVLYSLHAHVCVCLCVCLPRRLGSACKVSRQAWCHRCVRERANLRAIVHCLGVGLNPKRPRLAQKPVSCILTLTIPSFVRKCERSVNAVTLLGACVCCFPVLQFSSKTHVSRHVEQTRAKGSTLCARYESRTVPHRHVRML